MLKVLKVRGITIRERGIIWLAFVFSFLLPTNGAVFHYLFEAFGLEVKYANKLILWTTSLLVLLWLMDARFFRKWKSYQWNWKGLSLPILFFSYIILLFLDGFHVQSIRSFERAFPLLLFPLVMISERRLFFINKDALVDWFRYGVLFSGLAISFRQFVLEWGEWVAKDFTYVYLFVLNHPTYFSIAVILSCILLFQKLHFQKFVHFKWYHFLEFAFYFALIFMSSSKAGIVCLALFFLFVLFQLVQSEVISKLKARLFVLALLVAGVTFATTNRRFKEVIDVFTGEYKNHTVLGSSGHRVELWRLSGEIVGDKWGFGLKESVLKEKRLSVYEKYDLELAVEFAYNQHNQFLEYFVTGGLFQLLVFIFSIIGVFLLIKGNLYALSILWIFVINMFFESVLEKQHGMLLFSSFITFLIILKDKSFITRRV